MLCIDYPGEILHGILRLLDKREDENVEFDEFLCGIRTILLFDNYFEEMEQLGLLEGKKRLYTLVEQSATLRPPEANAIVHGDLYFSHILVNEKGKLAGVIDWGDIHIGDVAIDLVHHYQRLHGRNAAFRRQSILFGGGLRAFSNLMKVGKRHGP